MKKIFFLLFIIALLIPFYSQSLPKVVSGTIQRLSGFKSQYVAKRNIDIWLPEGYNKQQKYDVVYMHDGQMLFDSIQAWNHQEWGVDETLGQLQKENKIRPTIVVAIWNTGETRIPEYFPNAIFKTIKPELQKSITEKYGAGKEAYGDAYLKFVVEELKPYIDQHYSVYTTKEHTFMMGSSMGELISVYALGEYPEVFGGVGCLSTAWLSFLEPHDEIPFATIQYLRNNLPIASDHKIYMDYGTGESDVEHVATQSFIDMVVRSKGYDSLHFKTMAFEKAEHNEKSWNKRLSIPVEFLLSK